MNIQETFNIPFSDTGKRTVYAVISFSCGHCIELIPSLSELNRFNRFRLITDGDDNDNQNVAVEYNYTFPIYSYKLPLDRVHINHTPACLVVDENGDVESNKFTPSISDMIALLQEIG